MKQERQLIEKILRALPNARSRTHIARLGHLAAYSRKNARPSSPDLRLGPGDDAAIISFTQKKDWVLSCDAFIEEIHFRIKTHPPTSIGYKALARATSDLAAMGATPRYFLLTLALPKGLIGNWLDRFLDGMARASRQLGLFVIGGDTTVGSVASISITVLGSVTPDHSLRRAGARPGDLIYVSGTLGRAQLGLELVLSGLALNPKFRSAVQPHLYPRIQLELSCWLTKKRIPNAMMDISDGLSTDLARLCAASHVGARIHADKIPTVIVPPAAERKLHKRRLDPLRLALHGGEDYELLFTVAPGRAKKLRDAPASPRLTAIGEVTSKKTVVMIDGAGKEAPLKPLGWDPF